MNHDCLYCLTHAGDGRCPVGDQAHANTCECGGSTRFQTWQEEAKYWCASSIHAHEDIRELRSKLAASDLHVRIRELEEKTQRQASEIGGLKNKLRFALERVEKARRLSVFHGGSATCLGQRVAE